jgi:hypothetical protein
MVETGQNVEKYTVQITYASGRSERFVCTARGAELRQQLTAALQTPCIAFQLEDRLQLIYTAQVENVEISPLPQLSDVPAIPAERLGMTGTFGR